MGYSISICDTHRLPYFNGRIKAYKIGTTTPVKFKHGKTGTPQYTELRTNARGFICDTSGTILSRGIFVEEDALVRITFGLNQSTEWEVCAADGTPVNDGKLLGTKTKDSPDNDVEEKWSANSGNNYTLDYDHLIHKPRINEWMESNQTITMTKEEDSETVDKYAKTVDIVFNGICHPENWSLVNDVWTASPTDKPNSPWSIKLLADPTRVAQIICVRNLTPWRLAIKNASGNIVCTLDPSSADGGKFMALYGDEILLDYHGTVPQQMLGSVHDVRFTTLSPYNDLAKPLEINDYTPDWLHVVFESSYMFNNFNTLYLKSSVTTPRKIKLGLTNNKTGSGLDIRDSGNSGAYIGTVANGTVVELIVLPTGIGKASSMLPVQGTTLTLNTSAGIFKLKPEDTFISGVINQNTVVDASGDLWTDKLVYCSVNNIAVSAVTLSIKIGSDTLVFTMNPGVSTIVLHKLGPYHVMLKSTGSDITSPSACSGVTPNEWKFAVPAPVSSDVELRVNVNQLNQLADDAELGHYGTTAGVNDIVLDMPTAETTYNVKLHIDTFVAPSATTSVRIQIADSGSGASAVTVSTEPSRYQDGGVLNFNLTRSGTTLTVSNARWL